MEERHIKKLLTFPMLFTLQQVQWTPSEGVMSAINSNHFSADDDVLLVLQNICATQAGQHSVTLGHIYNT